MQELNIVELIEKNPIAKLSNSYNSKLLNKLQQNFTGFEQQLFVSSFYCYLNYDKNIDFCVDLDEVWEWLGFSTKQNVIRTLEKHFKHDIDYKSDFVITKALLAKQNGGQNKQTILLTVKCFKSLCLKAQTKKASEIHEYYMKLEEVLHEIVEEETDELRVQLEQKENTILEKDTAIINIKKEKQKAVEQAIVVQFPVNTECIYFGTIDNTTEAGEKLIKFGHTNDLSTRLVDHRKKYNNFVLVNAFRVQNKVEIENLIKNYPKIKRQIRSIEINGKNKTEIIAYDATNFTIEKLSKHIKDIIHSKTYSIDNFNRIMKENEELKNENRKLTQQIKTHDCLIEKQSIELNQLEETLENLQKIVESTNQDNVSVYQNVLLPEDEMNKKFNDFVNSICIVRPDVEELSVNIEGRYRLWSQVKPTKEVFHALKNYLDTRFKPKRIQGNHGYLGIKLNTVEYVKHQSNSTVETFIFQVCKFSDCGKVLNSVLLREYQKWKVSVGKELTDNDIKEIKEYLNSSPYALKATVWTDEGNNEGYYGLAIKQSDIKPKLISSTGKKVFKREKETNTLLATWDTIVKASEAENMSAAKMSRYVKNKNIVNDYYYSVI
jgi:predicted nuclease with TOPRIM domain